MYEIIDNNPIYIYIYVDIFTISGGSGRSSYSRLASYICEYSIFNINVTKKYGIPEFKEDLKSLYAGCGVTGKPTSFIFIDNQITDEQFLEIINNMLSSGEVTNLYKPDEFEEVRNGQ